MIYLIQDKIDEFLSGSAQQSKEPLIQKK